MKNYRKEILRKSIKLAAEKQQLTKQQIYSLFFDDYISKNGTRAAYEMVVDFTNRALSVPKQ